MLRPTSARRNPPLRGDRVFSDEAFAIRYSNRSWPVHRSHRHSYLQRSGSRPATASSIGSDDYKPYLGCPPAGLAQEIRAPLGKLRTDKGSRLHPPHIQNLWWEAAFFAGGKCPEVLRHAYINLKNVTYRVKENL